ncbi:STM4011 family radical SAM protein [Azohydromonas lata]|uniref:STM4011 family radical SAM protein n=1 Tax=Azohydromonas lata TaxID=45677 RepID=A0ABU5IAE4_9BURK|nr:STM4011 family radical SAM protein [Azohydromonas lata]MDZ5455829.1 STM4011 family radical SAM protein [Azohydromonas lata]
MLTLLYRGSLKSCNYTCSYCPFAKSRDTRAALARDAAEVARFVEWVAGQARPLRVLFTPWGEAIVRRHYREAMLALAALPQVSQVALQTNLSGPLAWLADAPAGKLSLWCTYHPEQITLARFVERTRRLDMMGIQYSVGVVARREHYEAIHALRAALPAGGTVWLNAYDRRGPGYYTADDLAWLEAMDRWFRLQHMSLPSRGAACRAGSEVLSVDGEGELRRCHFIPQRIGNLYTDPLDRVLQERRCSRLRCECFIGYAQRRDLPLHEQFGDGLLARIPIATAC